MRGGELSVMLCLDFDDIEFEDAEFNDKKPVK